MERIHSVQSNRGALSFIFLTILIDTIGIGIIYPVLPKLIESLTGEGISGASVWGGWLTAAYAVMQFIAAPLVGSLSDKYGRRPILLLALLGFAIDYLFLAFASTIWWLFIGRIIAGITGASFTTASAYVADISTVKNRTHNFGMIGAAFGLGFTIGPVIGGLLGSYGERVPFLVATLLSFLGAIYGYFVLPESLSLENRRNVNWKRANPVGALLNLIRYPQLFYLILAFVLVYTAGHVIQSTWTFYTLFKFNWNERDIGISLGVFGLMMALVQVFFTKYTSSKFGNKQSLTFGVIAYTIGMFLFAFANEPWMLYAIMIPYSLAGITIPTIQSIISSHVPDNEQGELQGVLSSLISLTAIIGPLVMNNLFAYFTSSTSFLLFPGTPFIFGGLLMIITFCILQVNKSSIST
jgi:DHA1 family tetracycline resistance protein-like MFS transporter